MVSIRVPEGTGIKIKDYPIGRLFHIKYRPGFILRNVKRFQGERKNDIVYSNDLECVLDPDVPIGEQGVQEGDVWEVIVGE